MSPHQGTLGKTFVDPRSLVFWVMVGLTGYGLVHITPLLLRSVLLYPAAGFLAALLWVGYGLVLAALIYHLELFDRRSPVTMMGAFVWGAVVAAGISVVASPAVNELLTAVLPENVSDEWASAIAAPLVEEPLKLLGVVALAFIPSARITSTMDGLFYGLIVGLGFEVTESLLYAVAASVDQAGSLGVIVLSFILRGIVGGLWNHPTFTAISGAGVGYFVGSSASLARRTTVLVGTLLAAMLLHGFFDSPILEGSPLVGTIVKGLPVFLLLVVLYRWAQNRERVRFTRVGEASLSRDLITEDELASLTTRSARGKERKAARGVGGLAASHAAKRLQRRQSEYIDAVIEDGPESRRAHDLAVEIADARGVLQQVTAQSPSS